MPDGFRGSVAEKYLTDVERALEIVTVVHNTDPERIWGFSMPIRRNENPPYPANTAHTGGYSTGMGNSNNVVVCEETYDQALRQEEANDDRIGEAIYTAGKRLRELCQTTYILPATRPRFLAVIEEVENSLREFRGLTYEGEVATRRFVQEIMELEPTGRRGLFVWNAADGEAVRQESERIMNRQITNMRETISAYEREISNLRQEWEIQNHIANTAMRWTRRGQVPDTARRAIARENARQIMLQINILITVNRNLEAAIRGLEDNIRQSNIYFLRMCVGQYWN